MQKPSAFDEAKEGTPNLEVLQYLAKTFTPAVIATLAKRAVIDVSADASAGLLVPTTTIPIGSKIVGVSAICTAANTAGTITLKDNAASPVAISDAMVCAVDKVQTRSASIDDAKYIVNSLGLLIVAGGTDATLTRAVVVIDYI